MEFNLYIVFLLCIIGLSFPSQGLEERTAMTIHGDIYDCIDFLEQPSLKHLSLKDKKAVVKNLMIKFPPKKIDKEYSYQEIWMNGSCPYGTVPIQRMPKTWMQGRSQGMNHQLEYDSNRHIDFAGVVTKPNPNKFTTAFAIINTYNPQVKGGSEQYSSASVIFESGGGSSLNQIQAGWIVYPKIYGDQKTRLYAAWTADGYTKTGCFNTLCPGFVQNSTTLPLGLVLPDVSHTEGKQFDSAFYVQWFNNAGWGLYWGNSNSTAELIGYWPQELFNSMRGPAERVKLGGQVYTPPSDKISPQMGSGKFRNGKFDITCYMRYIFLGSNGPNDLFTLDNSLIDVSESRCYWVGEHGLVSDPYWRYRFIFGGAGGKDKITCVY